MSNTAQDSKSTPQPNGIPTTTTSPPTPHETKHLVESSYDQIATTYHNWAHEKPSPRLTWLEKVIGHLPPQPKVLELGCGAGIPVAHRLASHGAAVTANDISTAMLALCAKHVPSATLVKSDMLSLSFPSGTFDAVVGFYSIIHLPRDEQEELLGKVWGWLQDGGWLLANFAIADSEGKVGSWLDGKEMYWSSFGEGRNKEMVRGRGFEIVEAEVIVEIEHGREVPFLWILARKAVNEK